MSTKTNAGAGPQIQIEPVPPPDTWDEEADVVVVGLGGAGACAALEAHASGASVLVLERLNGGGATAVSGGVVYAGGGTHIQQEAGFEDTADEMFAYLSQEVKEAVSPQTLRHFCDTSAANLSWLADHGVPFEASLCPFKTSYPTDDYYLYYSGNESFRPFRDTAKPAPRGHRARGVGISGKPLYGALRGAIDRAGIPVKTQSRVVALVRDGDGRVVGVKVRAVNGGLAASVHRWAAGLAAKWSNYVPAVRKWCGRALTWAEARGEDRWVKVNRAVILSAGGFIRNREMVKHFSPESPKMLALGTLADDGSGIQLGLGAGAGHRYMHRVSAWRFYNPPLGFVKGLLLSKDAQRICNEELYGAAIGRAVIQSGCKAWLVLDADGRATCADQVVGQTIFFQRATAWYLLWQGHRKANSLAELAKALRMPSEAFQEQIQRYNQGAESGEDALGKSVSNLTPILKPPFYAFDVSIGRNPFFPTPSLTLGGLSVEERSGQVLDDNGAIIPGLYAAGRNAAGVASEAYVSGLSIADCVYSGRRAGRHAAGGEWHS